MDAVLRYTNVLDGLFHRMVVIAEAEGDCAFLAAAMDCQTRASVRMPRNEVLFVPTGGKDAMWKVASALRAVKVPVIAAPDLDLLADGAKVAQLVEALEGEWSEELETLLARATAGQRAPREPAKVRHVLEAINSAYSERLDEDFTADAREDLLALARTRQSPWVEVKEYGIDAFKGTARGDVVSLLGLLGGLGVVLVQEGELERLAPEVPNRKGPGWLQAALEMGAQCNDATQAHIGRILSAGERILANQLPDRE